MQAQQTLLTWPQLRAIVNLSRTTVWREIKEKRFPAPVKTSPNRVAWVSTEVEQWLEARRAERSLALVAEAI